MHRHVIAHCNRIAGCVVHRARIIPSLLDVGRVRGLAQHHAHFFGNRDEEVAEQFQFDRVRHIEAYRGLASLSLIQSLPTSPTRTSWTVLPIPALHPASRLEDSWAPEQPVLQWPLAALPNNAARACRLQSRPESFCRRAPALPHLSLVFQTKDLVRASARILQPEAAASGAVFRIAIGGVTRTADHPTSHRRSGDS